MRSLSRFLLLALTVIPIALSSGSHGGVAAAVRTAKGVTAAAAAAADNPVTGRAYVMSGATGETLLTLAAPDPIDRAQFGHAVAAIGDVDGDGVPDLAVGAPRVREQGIGRVGRVYLFSGSDGTLLRTIVSPAPDRQMRFGFSLAPAGDLDDDGAGDLVVGAPKARTPGRGRTGRAWVISGGTGATIAVLEDPGIGKGSFFGWSVASGSDVTGDGLADVLVGVPGLDLRGRTDQGRVYLFDLADPNNPARTVIEDPLRQSYALFGRSVAFMGDVSGDAVPEILVGADGQDASPGDYAGRVFVISGADPNTDPNGGNVLQSRYAPAVQSLANFGFAVAGLEDVSGDSLGDFAASAPEHSDGHPVSGIAWVLGGDPNAPSEIASLDDPDPNSQHRLRFLGGSIAAIDDLTADGLQEVAVGSELSRDPNGVRTGRVYVFEARDGALHMTLEPPDGERDVCARFGWSVAPAGDVDDDGLEDIIVGAPLHRLNSVNRRKSCF